MRTAILGLVIPARFQARKPKPQPVASLQAGVPQGLRTTHKNEIPTPDAYAPSGRTADDDWVNCNKGWGEGQTFPGKRACLESAFTKFKHEGTKTRRTTQEEEEGGSISNGPLQIIHFKLGPRTGRQPNLQFEMVDGQFEIAYPRRLGASSAPL